MKRFMNVASSVEASDVSAVKFEKKNVYGALIKKNYRFISKHQVLFSIVIWKFNFIAQDLLYSLVVVYIFYGLLVLSILTIFN
jgi:myosin-crossreactive antigen